MSKLSFQEYWSSDEDTEKVDAVQHAHSGADSVQHKMRAGMMLDGEPTLDRRTGKYMQRVIAIPVPPTRDRTFAPDPSLSSNPRLHLLQPDLRFLEQNRSDSDAGPLREKEPTSFDMSQEQRVRKKVEIVESISLIGDRTISSQVPDAPIDISSLRILPAVQETQGASKTLEPIFGTDEHLTHVQPLRSRHVHWNDSVVDRGRVVDDSVAQIGANHGHSETLRPDVAASNNSSDSRSSLIVSGEGVSAPAAPMAFSQGMVRAASMTHRIALSDSSGHGSSVQNQQPLQMMRAASMTHRIAPSDSSGHGSSMQNQQPLQRAQQQQQHQRMRAHRALTSFVGGRRATTSETRSSFSRGVQRHPIASKGAISAQGSKGASASDRVSQSMTISAPPQRTDTQAAPAAGVAWHSTAKTVMVVPLTSRVDAPVMPSRRIQITTEEASRAHRRTVSLVQAAAEQSICAAQRDHQDVPATSLVREAGRTTIPARQDVESAMAITKREAAEGGFARESSNYHYQQPQLDESNVSLRPAAEAWGERYPPSQASSYIGAAQEPGEQGGSVAVSHSSGTKRERLFRPFLQPPPSHTTVQGTIHGNVENSDRSASKGLGRYSAKAGRLENASTTHTQAGTTSLRQLASAPKRVIPIATAVAFASPHTMTGGPRNVVMSRVNTERSSAVGWTAGATAQSERAPDGTHDHPQNWQARERHQPREAMETERNLGVDDLLELQGRPKAKANTRFLRTF